MSAWPRTVVFDVGNVLLRWDPAALCAEHFRQPERAREINTAIFLHDDWQRLDEGLLEEEAANERFAARTRLPIDRIRQLVLASKVSLSPIEDSVDLLRELHADGVALYALTNMARGTFEFVRPRYPFWEHFRGIVVSAYLRTMKPAPAIFQRLLETYELTASECVFLDDNPANVAAAQALGIQGCVFQDAARARHELERLA